MPTPDLRRKLAILADAAKYDASCASSGSSRRRAQAPGAVGNTEGMGICHSYTPDGRCVSLLKVLLTNWCVYDCAYCVNRRTSDVERARFRVEELVGLVLDFYRRNYIEGLFLSSGIIRSADYTMEQLVAVARTLRREHHFNGYIHLKTIPEASPELVAEAGRWADRLSINVELPTQAQLDALAPEKQLRTITRTMGQVREGIEHARVDRAWAVRRGVARDAPRFAPAGQTTQMIVGATDASDAQLLHRAASLYDRQRLRRVYYSAFSPIPAASPRLPLVTPPLVREHRLYQADWLMRFYGFAVDELAPASEPSLPLDVDPKLGWALRSREWFPVDVNTAERELLLRVPGFGRRTVDRLVRIRRWRRIRLADLVTLRVPVKRALPFVVTEDHAPTLLGLDALDLRARVAPARQQLDLFATATSARTGEL